MSAWHLERGRDVFRFEGEQAMLADGAASFFQAKSSFEEVRKRMPTESGFDASLLGEMAALGWLGLAIPETFGGAGLPVGDLVPVLEPMGRHLFASPLLATTLAAQMIASTGGDEHRRLWLPRLSSGGAIGAVALTEPEGSWQLTDTSAQADPKPDGFVLSGTKTAVLDGQNADLVVGSFLLAGEPALFLVERSAFGASLRRETIVDETRRSARIRFDGLHVPQSSLLARDPATVRAELARIERLGALLVAAEACGGAEGVMGLTLDYLRTRKQFGRLIGGFQALKHPMVEILIAVEHARSLLYHAAAVFDGPREAAEIAVRMAKAHASDTFTHAADRAIQFHGAIGFTYECHAQLFFRRAQWCQYAFGDARHHRRRLAELMLR